MTRVRLKIGLCSAAVTSKNYCGQPNKQTGYMRILASNEKDTRMRGHVVKYPWDQFVLLKCTIFATIYGVNDNPSKTK
jgi:hypothetical protein